MNKDEVHIRLNGEGKGPRQERHKKESKKTQKTLPASAVCVLCVIMSFPFAFFLFGWADE